MKSTRILGLGGVLALLTVSAAPAQSADQSLSIEAMRHRQALGLFEDACLSQAPDFGATRVVFETMGLRRPAEKATFRHPALGIHGGVVPVQAGDTFGRQCSVLIERGRLPILVLGLRDALTRISVAGSVSETPPSRATDPVLWDFRMPGIGLVSVTAGMSAAGIAILGMQVADRPLPVEVAQ